LVKTALALALIAACGGSSDDPPCDPAGAMCKHLSQYALFDDIAMQTPAEGVIAYDVNTPLFSDYAKKQRFLYLPPGASATWSDHDAFELPEGAILIKTFAYPPRLLETRLLIRGPNGWHGASYVYDADGTDAALAIAGKSLNAQLTDDSGMTRDNTYIVPNQNQCKNCHAEHDEVLAPLGPKARHVNKGDQLQQMIDHGQLTGAPAPEAWPKLPVALDPTTGTVEERARAWLDINCGHCHNPTGAARTSGLYLDWFETDPALIGVCKPPVATGRGSGGRQFDIIPGKPDLSIMTYRIESTDPEIKMPELGRNLVHAEGVALIREWITAMPGGCAGAR
jgi:uncharacterized repeat protein (TIGR03806 family)